MRVDYLEDVEGDAGGDVIFGVEERLRVSVAATYHWDLSAEFGGHARLQANFDDLEESEEQSLFLQIGFDYGGNDEI